MNKQGPVIRIKLESKGSTTIRMTEDQFNGYRKKLILYAMEFRLLVKRVHEKENDPVAQQTNIDVLSCLTEWVGRISFCFLTNCMCGW